MAKYTYEDNLISDLYKDAYGYRPDQWWMMLWSGQTPGWKQVEWDRLCDVMNESIEMEKQMEKVSLDEFKKTLRATMKTTGTHRSSLTSYGATVSVTKIVIKYVNFMRRLCNDYR